jgi:hypothetical protein
MVSNYSDQDLSTEALSAGAEFLLPKEDLYLLPKIILEKMVY